MQLSKVLFHAAMKGRLCLLPTQSPTSNVAGNIVSLHRYSQTIAPVRTLTCKAIAVLEKSLI